MIDCKKKYRNIVDKLIKKSYPILKNKRIIIREKMPGDFTAYVLKFPFFMIINLDPRARNYSKKLLTGLFSHELSHLEDWQKHQINYYLLFGFKIMSKKFRIDNERKTDICAINKGYAKQLYSQRKSRWDEVQKNHPTKEIYMSPQRIKSYAKKIGKWQ